MSASITIREIDKTTTEWINREAKRRGVSVEKLSLQLLRKGIRLEREKSKLPTYHDLDSLAGTWSEDEAQEFLNAVSDLEQVDEKLWR
jgi:hypothetical protein